MLTSKQKRQQALEFNQGPMAACIRVCRMIREGIYKCQSQQSLTTLNQFKKFGISKMPSASISQWLGYRRSPFYQGAVSEYLSRVPVRYIKESS